MTEKILAYDLGTGGNKASLYEVSGKCLASSFAPYETLYPRSGSHEQRPDDWWDSVVKSTRILLEESGVDPREIECLAISGHSLGVVPINKEGQLLRKSVPIWSDSRAREQADVFFQDTDPDEWYKTTGNGFPRELYSVFKILWYRDNEPDTFRQIRKVLGTKDYINYLLTGQIQTDYSYASGSGIYDLKGWQYSADLLAVSGLSRSLFPDIVSSTEVIGTLSAEAASRLGLTTRVKVACGGVDNSCMALGAGNIQSGRVYLSLGSSAWIAVSADEPILDLESKPFVFTHVIPGLYTSAVSIFSAGSSYRWLRDQIFPDLNEQAGKAQQDVYDLMGKLAAQSPVGANKLLFNPSLAGGSSQEPNPGIRGALTGLDLGHSRADLARAGMEGIAMNLGLVLSVLKEKSQLSEDMVIVGGGSKSSLWRQILADVFNLNIIKTNIGEDAGSLGAAALAAIGCGLWDDFEVIDQIQEVETTTAPVPENHAVYQKLLPAFEKLRHFQASLGAKLREISI